MITPLKQDIFKTLEERVGRVYLRKRLQHQVKHTALRYGTGFRIHWEEMKPMYILLKYILKLTGLYHQSTINTLDYRTKTVTTSLENLPDYFDNFRVLHLSDIHIEGIIDRGERLIKVLKGLNFDLCVITGDFRYLSFHDYEYTIEKMETITEALKCEYGIIGVLGNHDYIEMVPGLESLGIKILINEATKIQINNDHIWITGVDDPSLNGISDLNKSLCNVPYDDFKLLLVHSPELIVQAAQSMVDYYLCGHTHGGQVCLPWEIPLITNSRCSRRYVSGPWKYGKMKGYTSSGVGSSGLSVRLFCPPELVIHLLKN